MKLGLNPVRHRRHHLGGGLHQGFDRAGQLHRTRLLRHLGVGHFIGFHLRHDGARSAVGGGQQIHVALQMRLDLPLGLDHKAQTHLVTAQLARTETERDRVQALFNDDRNVSERTLQTARSQVEQDRAALLAEIEPIIGEWPSDDLVTALNDAGVPSGRVNTVPEALDHPQVRARELVGELERQDGSEVRFVGFPAKLSASPASYRTAPPRAGEDGAEVLGEILDLEHDEIVRLRGLGIVG